MTALFIAANSAHAGKLDNYYLEQFGERPPATAQTAFKASVPEAVKCGMPLRKGLRNDWDKLESSTQQTLAKYLVKPVLTGEQTYNSTGGHFRIHYATTGADTPQPVAPYTLAGWIQAVATTFEDVYTKEITQMGYTAPSANPYDIYLQQLVSVFGLTDPDTLAGQSASSYITIDNDFADVNYLQYRGLSGLQITAAHEFHHAVQFFYNYYFETWYAEATASWMEDEVYDSVNQIYEYSRNYLQNPSISLDKPADGGYGRWIFNRLLAENHNPAAIRAVWERLRLTSAWDPAAQVNRDIPMLPLVDSTMQTMQSSLATEFHSFAKRLYTRDWATHTADLDNLYSVPLTIAASYTTYPVNQASTPTPTTPLAHYSMKYYRFLPSPAVNNLTVTITSSNGIQTSLFKKAAGTVSEITVNSGGSPTGYTYTVTGFGSLNPNTDEVVLVAVNTTATDNLALSCSTDGSTPPLNLVDSSGGSGGGCFIATAAYGSYLHPKVLLLRNFRDNYLLTTPWGRNLVSAYYQLSPPLAGYIAKHETLRLVARLCLIPLIFAVEHFWLFLTAVTGGSGTIVLLALRFRNRALQNSPCS